MNLILYIGLFKVVGIFIFMILLGDHQTGGTLTKPLLKLTKNTWDGFWYWTVGD
jgi:hypothetical protein